MAAKRGPREHMPTTSRSAEELKGRRFQPQEHLLRAAFMRGEPAILAWRRWRAGVDLEGHLDEVSFRLLPHLGRNLEEQGVDDPAVEKFRGISRHNWYKNQLLFRTLVAPLRSLRGVGIKTIVLDQAALALRDYPNHYLDPAADCPILVPADQAAAAFRQMQAAGWWPASAISQRILEQYVSAHAAHLFEGPTGSRIRLYWRFLPKTRQAQLDDEFLAGLVPARMFDLSTHTLDPTGQFLLACAPGALSRAAPRVLRAAVAMMALGKAETGIDWERLIKLATGRLWLPAVAETVSYLRRTLDAPLPMDLFPHGPMAPNSLFRKAAYIVRIQHGTIWERLSGLWFRYSQGRQGQGRVAKLIGFPSFLRQRWGVTHLWRVPGQFIGRAFWHMRTLR